MALERIKAGPGREAGLAIACPVKNEIGLLPVFLAHHRALGFARFLIIDNGSDDGTRELALAQDDCAVYLTYDSYAASRFAADWVSEVLHREAEGEWALYLDCDELLVYPEMERVSAEAFVAPHAAQGYDSFLAIMIDVYPEGDWRQVRAREGGAALETLRCFDKDYIIRPRVKRPWQKRERQEIEVIGGPRCRLFSTPERDARRGWLHFMLAGQVDRFVRHVPLEGMDMLARLWPRPMQAYFKTPLNLIGPEFRYPYSHESNNRNPAPTMLGILHLKFCDELNARFDPSFSYHNHYQRGLERFQLAQALARHGGKPLTYEGTRRFRSSDDLLAQQLIGPEPARVWSEGLPLFRTGGG